MGRPYWGGVVPDFSGWIVEELLVRHNICVVIRREDIGLRSEKWSTGGDWAQCLLLGRRWTAEGVDMGHSQEVVKINFEKKLEKSVGGLDFCKYFL